MGELKKALSKYVAELADYPEDAPQIGRAMARLLDEAHAMGRAVGADSVFDFLAKNYARRADAGGVAE